jgi:flagella basal body P-ring formation protein FlgA
MVVNNDRLVLGNIAEIFSDDAATTEKLRTISLGYAPNVGAVRELQRERILMAIASAGFSSDEVRFESPQIVRIRRASQTVESSLMRAAVEDVVLSRLKTVGAQAQLTRLDIPASVDVPTGEVEIRASIGTVKDLFSPFSVIVEILIDGRVTKRISAMAQAEAMMPVLVATRDIQPNERISEKDVCVETRKLSKAVTNYYRDFSKLRGAESNRAIAKGEIITIDSVVAGIVVKLGDTVRVMYKSGKFQIAVTGEARASGRIGERIQVKNIQSGNFLQAVIIDEGLVQVN